jgi:hypothetical protein
MWINDKKNITSNTYYLSVVSFFMNFANSIIFSNVAGLWANKWNSDLSILIKMKAISEAVGYFVKFLLGFMSDMKNNRKTFLLIGYGSVLLTKPLFLLSVTTQSSWNQHAFKTSNILDRIANNFRDTPRDAIIAYSSSEENIKQNLAYRKIISYIGSFAGALFSIVYFYYFKSFVPAFAVSTILSFIGFFILIFRVEDPIVIQKHEKPLLEDLKHVFSLKYVMLAMGFVILFAGKFGEAAIYPVFRTMTNDSIYFRLSFIAFYLGSFLSSFLIYKINQNPLGNIISSSILFSCVNFLVPYIKNPNVLLSFPLFSGIFSGVLESLIVPILLQFSRTQRKGTVIGITSLIIWMGYFIQSFAVGRFQGNQIYFFSTACLVTSSIVLMILLLTSKAEE